MTEWNGDVRSSWEPRIWTPLASKRSGKKRGPARRRSFKYINRRRLAGYPGIAECAVVGVPDERLGEVGAAYVVARPGTSLDPAEIVAWCRERMANYKAPRTVHVVDALPRNASGKVLKFELRQPASTA